MGSTLHSLCFSRLACGDEERLAVFNLFDSLVSNPNKKMEYTYEIYMNGLAGKINTSGTFNIDAYEAAIRKNQYMSTQQKGKKNVSITETSKDTEELSSMYEITDTQVRTSMVEQVRDAFEDLINADDLRYAISMIKSLNDDFIIEEGVDLILCIKQAVKGVPNATEKLKSICSDYEIVGEYIKSILESNVSVEVLFA